jgi:hypothetical protein
MELLELDHIHRCLSLSTRPTVCSQANSPTFHPKQSKPRRADANLLASCPELRCHTFTSRSASGSDQVPHLADIGTRCHRR